MMVDISTHLFLGFDFSILDPNDEILQICILLLKHKVLGYAQPVGLIFIEVHAF